MNEEHVAIVGAGQAGGRVAVELRRRGFDGAITIFGAEPYAPYERPALSKTYLTGEVAAPVDVYDDWAGLGVTLAVDTEVGAIDLPGRRVLAGARAHDFDHLVIATGGVARTLAVSGPTILTLRTRADADRLRGLLVPGATALVVGGGVVGMEVASSLTASGMTVVVVEAAPRLMGRALPAEPVAQLTERHRDNGVDIRLGARLEELVATADGVVARLADGTRIDAAFALCGVGMTPADGLAAAAGLTVDDGVVVEPVTQSVGAERVYAVGDVARPAGARRIESWAHANESAARAAAAILRRPPPAPVPAWFWTDQAGVNVQAVGRFEADRVVARPEGDGTVWLYLKDGRLVGAVTLAASSQMGALRRAVGASVGTVPLDDADRPLRSLLKALR
ncbi:NAD(P)/FAD-dependent oxidoreductase [Acuticoccus mangrovi]|uniref:FAD-dependent oxidoreductase n=1 Tax=Acuticoccus mangrovi TaxID=2796142 RepID=A0A934MHA1_9HYPH|nr:FAD-dependent oxidoreductase [Acuticoccus mangrovi]